MPTGRSLDSKASRCVRFRTANVLQFVILPKGATGASQRRENEMRPINHIAHVYGPEILQRMGLAFDSAQESLPANIGDLTLLRRRLALRIIRHVDQGELDPDQLRNRALAEMS
jgi:hypothetical protein